MQTSSSLCCIWILLFEAGFWAAGGGFGQVGWLSQGQTTPLFAMLHEFGNAAPGGDLGQVGCLVQGQTTWPLRSRFFGVWGDFGQVGWLSQGQTTWPNYFLKKKSSAGYWRVHSALFWPLGSNKFGPHCLHPKQTEISPKKILCFYVSETSCKSASLPPPFYEQL